MRTPLRYGPAGGRHTAADHDAGQAITATAVEASFDAGQTWTGLHLERHDDVRYTATIDHPALEAIDGYVTLRVKATDADGGTVDQRIDHDYRLK